MSEKQIDPQDMPAYKLLVEPEYEYLEVYDRVEEEGISSRLFTTSMLSIIIPLLVIIVVIGTYTYQVESEMRTVVSAEASYPVLADSRAKTDNLLNNYAVVDPQNGVYRIPIQEAMKMRADEAWRDNVDAVTDSTASE